MTQKYDDSQRRITLAIQSLRQGQDPAKVTSFVLGPQVPVFPADVLGMVSGVALGQVIRVLAAIHIARELGEDLDKFLHPGAIPDTSPGGDPMRSEAVRLYGQEVSDWIDRSNWNASAARYLGLTRRINGA